MNPHDLRRGLEAELSANPDDLATHSAYADLLMEQGDPRGEFVQVQLRLEDPNVAAAERRPLLAREAELLRAHQAEWLGALAPHVLGHGEEVAFAFRRGWLDSLDVHDLTVPLAREVARDPAARLLAGLTVREEHFYFNEAVPVEPGDPSPPDPRHGLACLLLTGSANLAGLRRFQLGQQEGDEWEEFNGAFGSDQMPAALKAVA